MSDGLWWLPSLVVFAAAAVGLGFLVRAALRAGARRERRELDAGRALEVSAKGLIVRADEAVRDARREVAYADAQFGTARSAPLREAVDRAEALLKDAFILQQRLDDAMPDTAAERRAWSTRISDGCRSAISLVEDALAQVAAARGAERAVPSELPVLAAQLDGLGRRCDAVDATIDRLGEKFAPESLAAARSDAARARAAVDAAKGVLDEASDLARSGAAPVADKLARAGALAEEAERFASAAERVEPDLAGVVDEARQAAATLEADLASARGERDALTAGTDAAEPGVAAAAVALGQVAAEASALLAQAQPALDDPALRRDRLRAAQDRLEVARADARRASGRLDGARQALSGALAIAEGQIRVASGLVDRGRGSVGADARTRLAEAERQLVIARQEPDPVAALDAARRAAACAADAEALARYTGA
ncbi:hypothetical protein ET445_06905 [Agromyces protaetiae]|uniref:TPM domain-containing protein n=1 Tax=Agromyces protaetiae TaxID=2509455 RepID=A0A4P6FGW7_9MICO|nr:hypothetical protein [Agromyces protaetiae]QAY73117.1 hypothetical protein ET445_06905 [Agromyces protaetiae]